MWAWQSHALGGTATFGLPGSGFGAAQTGIVASPSVLVIVSHCSSFLFIDAQFFALGFGEQQYCQDHDDISGYRKDGNRFAQRESRAEKTDQRREQGATLAGQRGGQL